MAHANWLTGLLVYLAAAVLAVPVAKFLGLGSIIGYLGAGILIGPWGLKFVTNPEDILRFAEFGVVLMLFLVGLELEPQRLWSLRKPIFGWGSVQLFGSAALLALGAMACGVDWRLAIVAGLGLAMSSTAIGLGVLAERNILTTTSGESILSVSLLQDIAAIPILALLPFLAVMAGHGDGGGWLGALKAIGTIAVVILGGRLLLRPMLRWIAMSDTPEIFTAAALLLVVATAALMDAVGLSMALGAFLAGVLLAESEYRRELETDIEPFKGLLLGLFFIAVGMSIDFAVILAQPWLMCAVVVTFLGLKAAALWGMARLMPIPAAERPVFIILLAQGGEFGFVVFQTAHAGGRDRRVGVVVPHRRGRDLDAADAAAAGRLRPLVAAAALRLEAKRPRGDQRAAERARRHRRLRPLRADRRPHAVRQRRAVDRARPRRRGHRGAAQVRLARLLRRCDPARPDAHGRRRQGQGHRPGDRRHRAERRVREDDPRELSRCGDHRRPGAQRAASTSRCTISASPPDRARDASTPP